MVLSIGLIGNLFATTPLAWGVEQIGWRGVFGMVVVFSGVAAVAVWLVVRDAPPGHPFLVRKPKPRARWCAAWARCCAIPGCTSSWR